MYRIVFGICTISSCNAMFVGLPSTINPTLQLGYDEITKQVYFFTINNPTTSPLNQQLLITQYQHVLEKLQKNIVIKSIEQKLNNLTIEHSKPYKITDQLIKVLSTNNLKAYQPHIDENGVIRGKTTEEQIPHIYGAAIQAMIVLHPATIFNIKLTKREEMKHFLKFATLYLLPGITIKYSLQSPYIFKKSQQQNRLIRSKDCGKIASLCTSNEGIYNFEVIHQFTTHLMQEKEITSFGNRYELWYIQLRNISKLIPNKRTTLTCILEHFFKKMLQKHKLTESLTGNAEDTKKYAIKTYLDQTYSELNNQLEKLPTITEESLQPLRQKIIDFDDEMEIIKFPLKPSESNKAYQLLLRYKHPLLGSAFVCFFLLYMIYKHYIAYA